MDMMDPCWMKGSVVSTVLGGKYADGKELPAIAGLSRRACSYDGAKSLRVNVTPLEPAMAEAVRKDVTMGMAGASTSIPADPDAARFQMQKDMGTCALHYVKGSYKLEVRLMSCRESESSAQAKLLKLPRVPLPK
jgi:hypothetical protein